MNPERLICATVTPFFVKNTNDDRVWWPSNFEAFAASGSTADMLYAHGRRGIGEARERVGTWREFAVVPDTGLVAIGSLSNSPAGQEALDRLQVGLDPWSDGPGWGLSVKPMDWPEGSEHFRILEASLEDDPAFAGTKIHGVGAYAGDCWTAITGRPVPEVKVLGTRTVYGKVLGVVRGKVIREQWEEDF